MYSKEKLTKLLNYFVTLNGLKAVYRNAGIFHCISDTYPERKISNFYLLNYKINLNAEIVSFYVDMGNDDWQHIVEPLCENLIIKIISGLTNWLLEDTYYKLEHAERTRKKPILKMQAKCQVTRLIEGLYDEKQIRL